MKFGIVVFPGTWSDRDCHYAIHDVLGGEADYVWHKETSLSGYDCIVLPGGFSYGDYLRAGAIARFSPVMQEVERFAMSGGVSSASAMGFKFYAKRDFFLVFCCPLTICSIAASGLISR